MSRVPRFNDLDVPCRRLARGCRPRTLAIAAWLAAIPSVPPAIAFAAGTSPADPLPFSVAGGSSQVTLTSSEREVWLRITPPVTLEATHFDLQTSGTLDTVLDVYANLADATAGEAIATDDDSGTGQNALVRVPIGFVGPYLARVRGYGGAYGTTTVTGTLALVPAGECDLPSSCSLTTAAQGEPTASAVLDTLRRVDRDLLQLSPKGRELSDLYWKASKELVPALVLDGDFRRSIFDQVSALLPLAGTAMATVDGVQDDFLFEERDFQRLSSLLSELVPRLSAETSSALAAAWNNFHLREQVGTPLLETLRRGGLVPDEARRVTLLAKLKTLPMLEARAKRTGIDSLDDILRGREIQEIRAVHPDTSALRTTGLSRTVAIEVLGAREAVALRTRLSSLPEVEWVEESGELRTQASTSDPYSAQLWGLDAVRAPEAWRLSRGTCSTLAAVVDTGVRADLLDFASRIQTAKGYDFADDDADPTDRNGHGTHVAGILAAAADNLASTAGVAPGICLFAVKVLSDSGSGNYEDVAAGIRWAADQGAKVINISAGCDCYSQAIEDALAYATGQHDVMIVAAAGNDSSEGVIYPASSPWVLGVGAVGQDLARAPFSNWGPGLDLVAPGVDIVSTFRDGGSCLASGTSMATPHVAGAAALVRSLRPFMTRLQVADALLRKARDLGLPGPDVEFGAGLVDAVATLEGTATISVSGPSSGPALSPLEFSAAASGCTPVPNRWTWESRPAGAYFVGGGQRTSPVELGWTESGSYLLTASNPGCPGASATHPITIAAPEPQTFGFRLEDGRFLTTRGTLVLVHGWQLGGVHQSQMWSCVRDCDRSAVDHPISDLTAGLDLNVVQFAWSGAGGGLFPAAAAAPAAANELSRRLKEVMGTEYTLPIHFIGHSLGTVVSAEAAAQIVTALPRLSQVQFTALDRPDRVIGFDFGPGFFPFTLAGAMRSGLGFKLDNYWSPTGWGVGAPTQGLAGATIYNHRRPQPEGPTSCPGCPADYDAGLIDPGDLGDLFFSHEGDNDHSGVTQWYRWSMDPGSLQAGTCTQTSPVTWSRPGAQSELHGSLNPCANGWAWSLFSQHPVPFPASPESDVPAILEAAVESHQSSGDESEQGPGSIALDLTTVNDRATSSILVPLGTRAFKFKLEALNSTASDFIAVLLDSTLIWSGQATVLTNGMAVPIGPVGIGELTGSRELRVQVVGNGGTQVRLSDLRAIRLIPSCSLPSTLCVTNTRFRVEADWEDHQQNRGEAVPRTVAANDSGFFWFFNHENLELVVKVLDGCGVNQRFWVFAAGLTDVGVRLRVTDTWTGESRTYENPRGTAFQPIQDTSAFPTCGASPAVVDPGTGVLSLVTEQPETDVIGNLADQDGTPREPSHEGGSGAGVSGKTLLLNGDRFAVTATWRTAAGATGEGTPAALTGDSGYFWFFDAGNIELVIKVLDGCGLNQRYWVFAGGLTDVQVTFTVRDTRTGQSKSYSNSMGSQFQPIADTGTFETCP